MSIIKDSYENGECPDCGKDIPSDVSNGDGCSNCGHVFYSPVKSEMDEPFESIKTYLIEDTLFVLQVDDMIGFYDAKKGEGSYDKLSDQDKTDLKLNVKKHLGYGLGEAWSEYMEISVELALENWTRS